MATRNGSCGDGDEIREPSVAMGRVCVISLTVCHPKMAIKSNGLKEDNDNVKRNKTLKDKNLMDFRERSKYHLLLIAEHFITLSL